MTAMARLEIVTEYGTWRQAPVDPKRLEKNVAIAAARGWEVDDEGYIKNGTAVTPAGTNRYNGQPVDLRGASFDLWLLVQEWKAAFPDLPKKNPGSVDRHQNHNPLNPTSDHAKAKASDQYPWSRKRTWEFIDWLDAKMDAAPVKRSYEGRRTQAGIDNWVWDGWTRRAGSPRRRLKPTSNQHRDHAHISVGLVDRRGQITNPDPIPPTIPPDPPGPSRPPTDNATEAIVKQLPTLRKGDTGDDVRRLQGLLVAAAHYTKIDGQFGNDTDARLRDFQSANGLVPDGVCGRVQTWPALLGV